MVKNPELLHYYNYTSWRWCFYLHTFKHVIQWNKKPIITVWIQFLHTQKRCACKIVIMHLNLHIFITNFNEKSLRSIEKFMKYWKCYGKILIATFQAILFYFHKTMTNIHEKNPSSNSLKRSPLIDIKVSE